MDLTETLAIGVFLLEVVFIFGFIVLKHHAKKESPWLVGENMNLQRNKLVYLLALVTLIVAIVLGVGFAFGENHLISLVQYSGLVIIPVAFIGVSIGLILVGVISIVTGKTVFYPGSRLFLPIEGGGPIARIWGIVYLLAGLLLILLIIAFVGDGICEAYSETCKYLQVSGQILSALESNVF